jgi:hypothetical protein
VKDIISGKLSLDDFDEAELDREKMEKAKAEIRAREARHKLLQGKPGKGHQKGYKLMCVRCLVEYMIDDIDKCTHCGKDLVTEEVSKNCRKIWNILEPSLIQLNI